VLEAGVLRDSCLAKILPARIGSHTIECLNDKSIKERYKTSGKQLRIVEVSPIMNQGDLLMVDCTEYRVSFRHGNLLLHPSRGYRVEWRFDCAKAEYVNVRVATFPTSVM
jgi:hypothetical protein